MPFSEQFSLSITNLILSNTPVSAFANVERYVALHDSDPTEDCSAGEIGGDGYIRTAALLAVMEGASGKMLQNSQVVVFPVATGTKAGQITHFSVWDTQVAGTPIGYGQLTAPANWTSGSSLSLAINALILTIVNKVP